MRHPEIDPRFTFAHDKESELEISFPGGTIRITAPSKIDLEDSFHGEIIVDVDEDHFSLNIRPVFRSACIIHVNPRPEE